MDTSHSYCILACTGHIVPVERVDSFGGPKNGYLSPELLQVVGNPRELELEGFELQDLYENDQSSIAWAIAIMFEQALTGTVASVHKANYESE